MLFQKANFSLRGASILCAAVLIVASFLFYRFYQQVLAPTEQAQQTTADETAGLPAEAPADEGWQTYRNEEYGFEVRYPVDFVVETSGGHHPEMVGRITVRKKMDSFYLDIDVIEHKGFSGIEDYMNKQYEDNLVPFGLVPINEIAINNISHQVFRLGNWDFFRVFLEHGDYIFDIGSPEKEFLEQMLSTFRFLD